MSRQPSIRYLHSSPSQSHCLNSLLRLLGPVSTVSFSTLIHSYPLCGLDSPPLAPLLKLTPPAPPRLLDPNTDRLPLAQPPFQDRAQVGCEQAR